MVSAKNVALALGGLAGLGVLIYYVTAKPPEEKPPEKGAGITQVRLEVV